MAGLIRGGVLDMLPWAFSGVASCGWDGVGWMTFPQEAVAVQTPQRPDASRGRILTLPAYCGV